MKRAMTVAYASGGDGRRPPRPMLRIANRWLLESSYEVGSKIEVEYANGVIKIIRVNK